MKLATLPRAGGPLWGSAGVARLCGLPQRRPWEWWVDLIWARLAAAVRGETGHVAVDAPPVPAGRRALQLLAAMGNLTATAYLSLCLSLTVWSMLPVLAGWQSAVITSGSMTPGIKVGDVLLYDRVDTSELKPGFVLLFENPARPGKLVSHRIVQVKDDGTFITKGDANQSPDSTPVRPDQVRGRARLLVPLVGRLALLNTPARPLAQQWIAQLSIAGLVWVGSSMLWSNGGGRPRHRAEDRTPAASGA